MSTSSRVARTGLTAAAVLSLPLLFAPQATADIDTLVVGEEFDWSDCGFVDGTCTVWVNTSGADATAPVTLTAEGTVVGHLTPEVDPAHGLRATFTWTPRYPGRYTLVATQGDAMRTETFTVCPSANSGSGVPGSACDLATGSTDTTGPESGSSSLSGILRGLPS